MSFKKTILTTLLITGMAAPVLASAIEIKIFNNTDFPSTSRMNGGKCSSELLPGTDGVTPKRTERKITDLQLRVACGLHPNDCVALVYLTKNCTGNPITTVNLTVSGGIVSVGKSTDPKNFEAKKVSNVYATLTQLKPSIK